MFMQKPQVVSWNWSGRAAPRRRFRDGHRCPVAPVSAAPAPLKASAPRGGGQGFSDQLLLRGEGSVSDSRPHGRGPGAPLRPGSPQSHWGGQRGEGTCRGCRLSSGSGDLGRQTPCGGRCGETEDTAVAAGGPDQRWPGRSHTPPAQAGGPVLAPTQPGTTARRGAAHSPPCEAVWVPQGLGLQRSTDRQTAVVDMILSAPSREGGGHRGPHRLPLPHPTPAPPSPTPPVFKGAFGLNSSRPGSGLGPEGCGRPGGIQDQGTA